MTIHCPFLRIAGLATLLGLLVSGAEAGVSVDILYLERQIKQPPILSNLDPQPADDGLAGARLGLGDNVTTGRFLGHDYTLREQIVRPEQDFLPHARTALASAAGLVVVNAPAADLLALADLPEARNVLLFNGSARDNALRLGDCRANVLHTVPSRAMLADAMAQFLVKRQWTDWFLIEGSRPDDTAFAEAIRRAATKFGARIQAEKVWRFDADMRRNAAQEVPLFTQDADYDVLVVADEAEDFARYLPYNTWDARPVAGSEGLMPRGWSAVVERWGAAQLQSRFQDLAARKMTDKDYAVWLAVRSIGEAVTRTETSDPAALRTFLLSDDFALAAFKGRKLSFRNWNGQLRQPIPLVHPRAMVAQAPIEGFLHRVNTLDSLGFDQPESDCQAFQ